MILESYIIEVTVSMKSKTLSAVFFMVFLALPIDDFWLPIRATAEQTAKVAPTAFIIFFCVFLLIKNTPKIIIALGAIILFEG